MLGISAFLNDDDDGDEDESDCVGGSGSKSSSGNSMNGSVCVLIEDGLI